MRVNLDAGALARALGDQTLESRAPGGLAEIILPTLDISAFLSADQSPVASSDLNWVPFGQGRVRGITLANPAAGADFSFTVPAGSGWTIESLYAHFVASATVANRVPRLVVRDPSAVTWVFMPSNAAITASQGADLTWLKASNDRQAPAGLLEWLVNMPPIFIPPGWQLLTITNAIAAGDQWSAIKLMVREYATS